MCVNGRGQTRGQTRGQGDDEHVLMVEVKLEVRERMNDAIVNSMLLAGYTMFVDQCVSL